MAADNIIVVVFYAMLAGNIFKITHLGFYESFHIVLDLFGHGDPLPTHAEKYVVDVAVKPDKMIVASASKFRQPFGLAPN